MAATADLSLYKDALIVLATAGVVVPVMHRLKVSPVLGYVIAGVLLGPSGLGALARVFPDLEHVTLKGVGDIEALAELGVVFLLFVIGLELSAERLLTMRRLVFGLGGLQVAVSALVIGLMAPLFGHGFAASVLVGLSLALSSTAVVLEVLAQRKRLGAPAGRASFAILLFQDLAVVPILFLVGVLAQGQEAGGSVASGLGAALLQTGLALVVIVVGGRFVLRPLFRQVAATQSPELFMAATLLVAIGAGVLAAATGLSMALGGFLAGLLLAETEFRKTVEAVIAPFKGLLLGVFFISVGLRIDLWLLFERPISLFVFAAGLIAIKAVIAIGLARVFGLTWSSAIEAGLVLGPGGEFAFIVLGLAIASGVVLPDAGASMLVVVALTIVAIPFLSALGERIARRMAPPPDLTTAQALEPPPPATAATALVVGAGRVGRVVSELLTTHAIPHIVTDRVGVVVSSAREEGLPAYYGNSSDPAFLTACGIGSAKAAIITLSNQAEINAIVSAIRRLRPDIEIIARASDAEHARKLYRLGVSDAVPETIEASLQLSEASLAALGVPAGLAIASVHERRDLFRQALQDAAGRTDRTTLGVRASTRPPPAM